MTQLVNQPSLKPSRKIGAVILASVIVAAARTGLETYWPDAPMLDQLPQLEAWIQAGLVIAAGYLTRERAK